jgi:cold shock CspA family protein
MSCRVVVDRPHLHHKEGNLYQIRIDLKVPGGELAVKREPTQHADYKNLDILIRDAFDEMRRQLEDHARRQHGAEKAHESLPRARAVRIFRERGYGFLQTPDDREIYFHKNSVIGANFEDLTVGTEVSFVEELGDKGPQAREIVTTGRSALLSELREKTPPVPTKLLAIPGLGPRRIHALHRSLHIRRVEQLARAARKGRIDELPGFGEKTEQQILQSIESRISDARRFSLGLAVQYAEPLVDYLKQAAGVKGQSIIATFCPTSQSLWAHSPATIARRLLLLAPADPP